MKSGRAKARFGLTKTGNLTTRRSRRDGANINGTMYKISAWTKTSQSGVKFLSLAIEPDTNAMNTASAEPDDDLPF